jgi:hypothetical protein
MDMEDGKTRGKQVAEEKWRRDKRRRAREERGDIRSYKQINDRVTTDSWLAA